MTNWIIFYFDLYSLLFWFVDIILSVLLHLQIFLYTYLGMALLLTL